MNVTRILITTDTVGGVWTYSMELARALAGLGMEPCLAAMPGPLTPDQREEARGLRLRCGTFKLEWMEDPWPDVHAAGEWLLDLERQWRPDVVHVNGYAHGALAWRAPVMVTAHSCVLSWWRAVKGEPAPEAWHRYHEEARRGLNAAALVAAPTAAMLAEAGRYYGPLRATAVIPNGREAGLFPPGSKEPLVFAAGRLWDEAKNLAALDRAARDLRWPVVVAGDVRHPDGTERGPAHARSLGRLPSREIARWMGRAAVYALPARYEPFGLSVLEAALAGCALVVGDIPSLRENWQGAARFVHPDDSDALGATLEELLGDPAETARMAAAARARALTFTPERMAAAYLEAYDCLVRGAAAEWPSVCTK